MKVKQRNAESRCLYFACQNANKHKWFFNDRRLLAHKHRWRPERLLRSKGSIVRNSIFSFYCETIGSAGRSLQNEHRWLVTCQPVSFCSVKPAQLSVNLYKKPLLFDSSFLGICNFPSEVRIILSLCLICSMRIFNKTEQKRVCACGGGDVLSGVDMTRLTSLALISRNLQGTWSMVVTQARNISHQRQTDGRSIELKVFCVWCCPENYGRGEATSRVNKNNAY